MGGWCLMYSLRDPVDHAAMPPRVIRNPFETLAATRGVTIPMCEAAALADRLGDVVRLPKVARRSAVSHLGHPGVEAVRRHLHLLARRWSP